MNIGLFLLHKYTHRHIQSCTWLFYFDCVLFVVVLATAAAVVVVESMSVCEHTLSVRCILFDCLTLAYSRVEIFFLLFLPLAVAADCIQLYGSCSTVVVVCH